MPTRLRNALPEILFSLVALALIVQRVLSERAVFLAAPGSDWNSSEWLIDYAGGFVRRGLSGEYVVHLMRLTGWSFLSIWIVTTTVAYVVLCVWLLRVSARLGGSALWRFALLFNPALLLSQAWYSSIGRKDSFFLLGLLAIVAAGQFTLRRNPATANQPDRAISTALLVAVSILCSLTLALLHEGLLLFALLPSSLAAVAYVLRRLRWSPGATVLLVAVAFGPSLAATAVSSLHHGDAATAVTICRSWHTFNIQTNCTLNSEAFPPAIDALSWNFQYGLSLSLKYAIRLPLFFVIFAVLASFQVLSVRAITSASLDELIASCLVPFVLSLPLYLLGRDWGRWMCMTSTLSLILMLSSSLRPAVFMLLPAPLRARLTTFATEQPASRTASSLITLAERHPLLFSLALVFTPIPYGPTLGAVKSVPAALLVQTLHHALHLPY